MSQSSESGGLTVPAVGCVLAVLLWFAVGLSIAGRLRFWEQDWSVSGQDGWHLVVDLASVIAAGLSVVAIYVALSARAEATKQLARERRVDFELDALLTLMDRVNQVGRQDESLDARVRLIAADDLPITGWAVGLREQWPLEGIAPEHEKGHPDQYRATWAWFYPDGNMSHRVSQRMHEEILAAIDKRLNERT